MEAIDYSKEGMIFDIQRYSINDGPGIRTIVFLKGCPLRCVWCSNPESQMYEKELMYRKILCINCGNCVKVCKNGAIGPQNENWIDREKCVVCGECVNVCPASALVVKGKLMSVEEVISELKKDESYYLKSNGGITLSGGEALMQPEFTKELLKAAKSRGWHTTIETEGYVSENVIKDILRYVDLVLLDIKANNSEIHKKFTKVDNTLIKKNAKIIQEMTKTVIRIPLIPGVNSDIKEFTDIIKFVKTLENVNEIHILPYHNFGESKYYLLGRDYQLSKIKKLNEEYVDKLKNIVEEFGYKCEIGG